MRRRDLLGMATAPLGCAVAPLELRQQAATAASRHVIDRLDAIRLKVNRRGDWVLLRTHTSSGLSGLGDCSHGGDDISVLQLLTRFQVELRGRSIFSVEALRQWGRPHIERHGRPAAVAISAIEQSLWDLQGQALGVPTYELFGGRVRSEVRQYANVNRMTTDRTPAGFAASVAQAVADGFDAVKMAPFDGLVVGPVAERRRQISVGVACCDAARRVLGVDRDLLVDVHSLLTVAEGLDLVKEMERLKLYWLEEVTPAESLDGLATINRATSMTTAGGEALLGIRSFYQYAAAGAVDVLMPDVKWCGGLLELRKVAAMAEGMGLKVSPHGPASPVGNVAAGHACVTLPNCDINEFAYAEVPWRAELVQPPEAFEKGRLSLTDRPGFGIVLNERIVSRFALA